MSLELASSEKLARKRRSGGGSPSAWPGHAEPASSQRTALLTIAIDDEELTEQEAPARIDAKFQTSFSGLAYGHADA